MTKHIQGSKTKRKKKMKIKALIPVYLRHLKTIGRSDRTILNVRNDMRKFIRFLESEKVFILEDLTADIAYEYQQDLAFSLTAKGKPLTLRTQAQLLSVVKGFTRFLKEKDYLIRNPGEQIKLPKKPKRLPKVIMDKNEVQKLIDAPDTHTNRGYRNRVILEILYDTAVRRSEIRSIKLPDLDLESGYILIHGKGNKERVVPLSERVCELIRNYILFVRINFLIGDDPGYLILNRWGEQMTPSAVYEVVRSCLRLSGIKKKVSTHSFRHTCATHMLKNGAPIRHIQEMLGHESLESTQIYTKVTINDLKEIHAKYHPGNTEE